MGFLILLFCRPPFSTKFRPAHTHTPDVGMLWKEEGRNKKDKGKKMAVATRPPR
jgi:hypothetical protein